MRWSLILSTFITVLFVILFASHALPILPSSSVELERRAPVRSSSPSPQKTTKRGSTKKTSPGGSTSLPKKTSNRKGKPPRVPGHAFLAPPREYRKNAMSHPIAYTFTKSGVSAKSLAPGERIPYAKEKMHRDGDHGLERQVTLDALRKQGLNYHGLPAPGSSYHEWTRKCGTSPFRCQ